MADYPDTANLRNPPVLLLVAVGVIYLAYYSYTKLNLRRRRKAFIAQHGCKEPTTEMPYRWDVFGFVQLYNMLQAIKANRLLEYWEERFDLYGPTYSTMRNGVRMIATKDPENIKAVLATKFDDW